MENTKGVLLIKFQLDKFRLNHIQEKKTGKVDLKEDNLHLSKKAANRCLMIFRVCIIRSLGGSVTPK